MSNLDDRLSSYDSFLWDRYGKNDKIDWLRKRFIRQQEMIDVLLDHLNLEWYEDERGVRPKPKKRPTA